MRFSLAPPTQTGTPLSGPPPSRRDPSRSVCRAAIGGAILVLLGIASTEAISCETIYELVSRHGSDGAGPGEFSGPSGIALSPSQELYIADSGNHRVQVFSRSGEFLREWGSIGTTSGQFYYPTDVDVRADGVVYVSDMLNHRIQLFDGNGTFLDEWGSFGREHGQLNRPKWIAVHEDGGVFVSEVGNNRMQALDGEGQSRWTASLFWPGGVAVNPDGTVFVVEYRTLDSNRLKKFSHEGKLLDMRPGGRGVESCEIVAPDCLVAIGSFDLYFVDPEALTTLGEMSVIYPYTYLEKMTAITADRSGFLYLTMSGSGRNEWIKYRPGTVQIRNATWGRIKSIVR